MILIGMGANLPSEIGSPKETLEAALETLKIKGINISRRSSWYESDPVPPSDQPPFVNAVAECRSDLGPEEILQVLHEVEEEFGRQRRVRWEARVIDLDLLAYHNVVIGDPEKENGGIQVPHPRMHQRRFVLEPLVEIAPDWRHPVLGKTARELLGALPEGDGVKKLAESG